jgi:hypothetical protein
MSDRNTRFSKGDSMAQEVIIQLFGSLRRYQREHSSTIVFPCSEPLSLAKLLLAISAERDKVQVVFANGRPVRDDYLVMPGDRISVFPKEYPIFADWKDFREKILLEHQASESSTEEG